MPTLTLRLSFVGLLLSLGHFAFGAKMPVFEVETGGIPKATNVPLADADYAKENAAALARANRTVAQTANYEAAMSPALKQLRSEILAIKNSDELQKKLEAISTTLAAIDKSDAEAGITEKSPYRGEDRDFRFYASQIAPLQCLRGIVWRFTPLAEKSGVVDSRLVTAVYRISHSMQILTPQVNDLPTPEERAAAQAAGEQNIEASVFDYLTKPYDNAVLFGEGYDLQNHLMQSCYTALAASADRIARLDLNTPIVWDNKMFFGVGTFPDDLDRYKLLGEPERHFSLAMKHAGMHFISFFRAYSIKDYFSLQTDLGRLYVIDSFPDLFGSGIQAIDGVSSQKRAQVIQSKGANTFLLYADGAKYLKDYSWPHLVRAIQEITLSWNEVKDRPENQRMIMNPALLGGFRRSTDETLKTWNRLIAGPTSLHSRLNDRVVTVDLRNFYMNPVADLKTFLPSSFDNKSQRLVRNNFKTMIADSKTHKAVDASSQYPQYRNWYYGVPEGYNLSAWKSIFPEIKDSTDIPLMLRTVNQAWGGRELSLPLMQFVR